MQMSRKKYIIVDFYSCPLPFRCKFRTLSDIHVFIQQHCFIHRVIESQDLFRTINVEATEHCAFYLKSFASLNIVVFKSSHSFSHFFKIFFFLRTLTLLFFFDLAYFFYFLCSNLSLLYILSNHLSEIGVFSNLSDVGSLVRFSHQAEVDEVFQFLGVFIRKLDLLVYDILSVWNIFKRHVANSSSERIDISLKRQRISSLNTF